MKPNRHTKKLGELEGLGIIELGRGKVISKIEIVNTPGDYPVYSAARLNNGEFGRYGKYMFDEELITWSVDGGGNFFYRPKHKYSVTNVCGWLRILKPDILSYKFLYFVLVYAHSQLSFDYIYKAHPSVIRGIYEIPLPPLSKQKRIVGKIEKLFAKIDEASRLRAESSAASASLLPSALHQVFSRAEKEEWEQVGISEIVEEIKAGFACSKSNKTEDGILHLRTNNINLDGELDFTTITRIPKRFVDQEVYTLKAGDILFNNTNSVELVGKTAVVTEDLPYAFSNHLTRIRVNTERVLPKFFVNCFRKLWLDCFFARLCTQWVNQAGVNQTKLKQIKIPLPPIAEQKKIVAYLDNLSTKGQELQETQKSQLADFSALRQSFLQQTFEGKL